MQTEVERETIRIPEPPESLQGRLNLGTALAFFGPGAIIASLTLGSGETGMYDCIGYTGLLREKRWGMLGHRDIDAIEDRIANLVPGEWIPLSERSEDVSYARSWVRAPSTYKFRRCRRSVRILRRALAVTPDKAKNTDEGTT